MMTDGDQRAPCSTELFVVGNLLFLCHASALNNGHSQGLGLSSSLQSPGGKGLADLASQQPWGRREQQVSGLSQQDRS